MARSSWCTSNKSRWHLVRNLYDGYDSKGIVFTLTVLDSSTSVLELISFHPDLVV